MLVLSLSLPTPQDGKISSRSIVLNTRFLMKKFTLSLFVLLAVLLCNQVNAWEERWRLNEAGMNGPVQVSEDGFTVAATVASDSLGAVYLFDTRNGIEQFQFRASDGAVGDRLGWSVAISGDGSLVAAGAPWDRDAGDRTGAVYLFDTTTGEQLLKLTADDASAESLFGWSVALNRSGNRLVVGAKGADGTGAVYLFNTNSGAQTRKLTGSDALIGSSFGSAVSISDTTGVILIGADEQGIGGAAYLFDGNTGSELHVMNASDKRAGDLFGHSVALSGDGITALIGAYAANNGSGNHNRGSAYSFDVASGQELRKFTASDAQIADHFGIGVALTDDGATALIGARGNGGKAYLIDVDTGIELEKLDLDPQATGQLGESVALNSVGDIAIISRIGAFVVYADGNALPYSSIKDSDGDGRADFLWRHQVDGRTRLNFMVGSERIGAQTTNFTVGTQTWKVAGLGDFDGDGSADILWRRLADNKLVIYFMDGATRLGVATASFVPAADWQVRAVQDFNGDGKADIYMRQQLNGSAIIHHMDGATRLGPGIRPDYHIRSFDWRPVGAADVDRNGTIDLLWRHESTGRTNVHFLDAAYQRTGNQVSDYTVDPLVWTADAVADYDGDGVGDIVFRSNVDGRTLIYHHTKHGFLKSVAQTDFTLGAQDWQLRVR